MTPRRNTKRVKITVKEEWQIKHLTNTPTFKNLSRIKMKIGENFETVNHKTFSDMKRIYPLIQVEVEELKKRKELS